MVADRARRALLPDTGVAIAASDEAAAARHEIVSLRGEALMGLAKGAFREAVPCDPGIAGALLPPGDIMILAVDGVRAHGTRAEAFADRVVEHRLIVCGGKAVSGDPFRASVLFVDAGKQSLAVDGRRREAAGAITLLGPGGNLALILVAVHAVARSKRHPVLLVKDRRIARGRSVPINRDADGLVFLARPFVEGRLIFGGGLTMPGDEGRPRAALEARRK